MALAEVSLGDKYDLGKSRILLTGIQAIVRLALMQQARDRRMGKHTAGYVTGYRGSPLGSLDQQLLQPRSASAFRLAFGKAGSKTGCAAGTHRRELAHNIDACLAIDADEAGIRRAGQGVDRWEAGNAQNVAALRVDWPDIALIAGLLQLGYHIDRPATAQKGNGFGAQQTGQIAAHASASSSVENSATAAWPFGVRP